MGVPAAALGVVQALGALASLVSGLKNIFDDSHDKIVAELDQVLANLRQLRDEVVQSTAEILEAIEGIRRQIDAEFAKDSISLADRALFSDLLVANNKEAAMGNSFEAADRLRLEEDVAYASAFIYVACIRLAVLKDFDPNYRAQQRFQEEFTAHRARLAGWNAQINDFIAAANRVDVDEVEDINPKGLVLGTYLQATYSRNGVAVRSFRGARNDMSDATRKRPEASATAVQRAGIEQDRQQSGVVDMERVYDAWAQAFR